MSWVVFDLDGTISDDRWRQDHLPKNGKSDDDYRAYHAGLGLDAPMNMHLVEEAEQDGHFIAFITSRPVRYRAQTKKWLKKHCRIDRWFIAMRPARNLMPSAELKVKLIEDSEIEFEDIHAFWDDRADVRLAMSERGVPCFAPPAPTDHVNDTVGDRLRALGDLSDEKNKEYGNAYTQHGDIMRALFPDGVTLSDPHDFTRYALIVHIVGKLNRYIRNFDHGHPDSLDDLSVYAMMLRSVDDGA